MYKKLENIVFLGSKKFGLNILKELYSKNKKLNWLVIHTNDKDDNRSYLNHFQNFCSLKKINFHNVSSIKKIEKLILNQKQDFIFVCGFYKILRNKIFNHSVYGTFGIHNSLLPAYRGGSPLVWQIINNEKFLGSSLFKFSNGIDNGPLLHSIKIRNNRKINIKIATDLLEKKWLKILPSILNKYINGKLKPIKQDESKATYVKQRKPKHGKIDWNNKFSYIDRFIRAQSSPYPGAFFRIKKRKIKIISHKIYKKKIKGEPGKIYKYNKKNIIIFCKDNKLININYKNY
mgnify:CR=1 FL=1